MLVVQDNREGEREREREGALTYQVTLFTLFFSPLPIKILTKLFWPVVSLRKNNMYVYTNFITAYVDNC